MVFALLVVALGFSFMGSTKGAAAQSASAHKETAQSASSITGLHVSHNHIVNDAGQTVRLLGAALSGTEYACVSNGTGFGVFDGPHDATAVDAMASWHINAVRISLNEDCWLDINGAPVQFSGTTYQQAIVNYVNLLNSKGMMAILDLHWNASGTTLATGQQTMADADHAPAFWTSVANTFKNNSSVLFDLYNEPHPQNWDCWLNGSTAANAAPCQDVNFAVAGMQALVNTVRATGANNILMLGGLAWANNLSQWLKYEPNDPQHNLAASFHLYNFNACSNQSCWNSQIAPVAAQVPIVTGELGENDCNQAFVDDAMNWFDQHGMSYTGWAWKPYGCGFPSLILNYDGTPSEFGMGVKNRLTALALAGLEASGNVSHFTGSYVGGEKVTFKHTVPLKGLTLTITIQKDPGMTYLAAYDVTGGRALRVSHTETATQIIYTFQQAAGTVLQPGKVVPETATALYRAQGGSVHSAMHDTFVLSAMTLDGQTVTDQGTIDGPAAPFGQP
jgi:hypothetical protein